jgi:hypothetical protein
MLGFRETVVFHIRLAVVNSTTVRLLATNAFVVVNGDVIDWITHNHVSTLVRRQTGVQASLSLVESPQIQTVLAKLDDVSEAESWLSLSSLSSFSDIKLFLQ